MSLTADHRRFGLSARARRFVIPAFVAAIAVIAVGTYANRNADSTTATGPVAGPVVGGDLHAVGQLGDRLYVGGHGGAGYRVPAGGWTQIESLADKDVMGWAAIGSTELAASHTGLYVSSDGTSFAALPDMANADVHAIGASDSVVYLATTELGVLVSTDGGSTFDLRSDAGQAFMGTIWVDPNDSTVAIAPSMQQGAVKTTDGGRTWTALGSSMGAMAVAVDSTGHKILALGMDGAEKSVDGGKSWSSLAVPDGTSAAAYDSSGELIVAALAGDRANVYREAAGEWLPLT